jgi:hypothetical protein
MEEGDSNHSNLRPEINFLICSCKAFKTYLPSASENCYRRIFCKYDVANAILGTLQTSEPFVKFNARPSKNETVVVKQMPRNKCNCNREKQTF